MFLLPEFWLTLKKNGNKYKWYDGTLFDSSNFKTNIEDDDERLCSSANLKPNNPKITIQSCEEYDGLRLSAICVTGEDAGKLCFNTRMTKVVRMTFMYQHYKVYFCFSLFFLVILVLTDITG